MESARTAAPVGFFGLLKATLKGWQEAKAQRLAAALAYYAVFTISPLLIVLIAIAGLFFGQAAVEGRIAGQIEGVMGREGAEFIQGLIAANRERDSGIAAAVIGTVTLLLGASATFGHIKDALNTLWGVLRPPAKGVRGMVGERLAAFGLVLLSGVLLLASLLASTLLGLLGEYLTVLAPGLGILFQLLDYLLSFALVTVLFALMYKILPDAQIEWRSVWVGAAFTAVLFLAGKFLVGLYMGNAASGSIYGAAGSLIVLLLWVYYISQIFFFGAKFTHVYANRWTV